MVSHLTNPFVESRGRERTIAEIMNCRVSHLSNGELKSICQRTDFVCTPRIHSRRVDFTKLAIKLKVLSACLDKSALPHHMA